MTGRVVSADGKGISGATVEWGNDQESFDRRQKVTTDENGDYAMAFESLMGAKRLAASAPGYHAQAGVAQITRSDLVRNFTLNKLPATGNRVTGQVFGEDGRPVEGVRVEAFTPVVGFYSSFSMPTGRDYFPGPDRVATTDHQGAFRIVDLLTDQVQLNLTSKYRHENDTNYPVQDGVRIEMSGSGQPGVIQGRVIDALTGLPIRPVGETRIVRRYQSTALKLTAEDGRFVLPGDAQLGWTYLVYVYAPGYASAEARISALPLGSREFVDIGLVRQAPLVGMVIDAEGRPVAGARLLYGVDDSASYFEWSSFERYADGHHSFQSVQHVRSNDAGEFWFAEPETAALGNIIVFTDGYQRMMLKPGQRQIDKDSGQLVIRLKRESALAGVVFKNGTILPDSPISVSANLVDGFHHMFETVRTDAQGRYKLGRLTPGTYRVSSAGCSRMVTLGDGQTVTANLGDDLGPLRIHGQAPPNVTITLKPEFEWGYTQIETASNALGEYEFHGLKPGKYQATVPFPSAFLMMSATDKPIEVTSDGQRIDLN